MLKTIKQIDLLEEAYMVSGAATLGLAYKYLNARIVYGFRDLETVSRFLFLSYYSLVEPDFLTGLEYQDFKADIEKVGGLDKLHPELKFFILFQHFRGIKVLELSENTIESYIRNLPLDFENLAENSLMAQNIEFVLGIIKEIKISYKRKIEREIYARFYGRGCYGTYVIEHLEDRKSVV